MTLKTGAMMLKIQICIIIIHYISEYIKMENKFLIVIIFYSIIIFTVFFYQINTDLVSIRDVFQKHNKKYIFEG